MCPHTCTYIYTYTHTCTHIGSESNPTRTVVCIHTYIWTCTYIYKYTCTHIGTCTYIYTYTHMHICRFGVETYPDGCVYAGEFKKSKRHGHGKCVCLSVCLSVCWCVCWYAYSCT